MARSRSHYNEPWCAEEVAKLKRLAGRDVTAREIAEQLGRTEGAVRSKAYNERVSLAAGARHAAGETWSGAVTRVKDYVAEKLVAGVTAYARANTGQAILIAAAAGCVLGFMLGGERGGSGGSRRTRGAGEDRSASVDSGGAGEAIADWESEGGSFEPAG